MAVGDRALCPVLIGRDDELSDLEDALLDACRGNGGVVVLSGDAGMGKTRLCTELSGRARTIGATVMVGGCSEADIALPYLPFLEAIGNWMSSTDLAAIRDRLGPSARELSQLFPQLSNEVPLQAMDPSQAKLRLFESLLSLIQMAADEGGLLLILEDLHWADASTRELVDYLTRRIRGVPALVVATHRGDEMHRKHPLLPILQGWRRSGSVTFVDLRPLPADGVAGMVEAIFSGEKVGADFRDFLHERTDGNPFVLEETLKEAIDRGDIFRTEGGWERKAVGEMAVPRSVADSILSRIERLDPEHADVVRAASVLGQAFSYQMLAALADTGEPVVRQALAACTREQILLAEQHGGRYRFRHALTREAVYEDIILPQRQALHGRAADLLTADPSARAADVAHHLLAAGRFDEAVGACLQAGDEAAANAAGGEAAALYERALPHITDPYERAVVTCKLGAASFLFAEVETARRYLEEGIDGLMRLGDDAAAAKWRLTLGRVHWLASRPEDAHREYDAARAALEPLGPSEDLAIAYIRIGALYSFNLENEESRRYIERAIATAEAAGADLPRVWAYGFKGLAILGEPDPDENEGYRWLDLSIEAALQQGATDVAGNGLFNTAQMRLLNGRAREVSAYIKRFEELPHVFPTTYSTLLLSGMQALFFGNLPVAEQLLAAAVEMTTRGQSPVWLAWSRSWLSRVQIYQLRLDEARPNLLGVDPHRERQELIDAVWSAILVALAENDLEEAARQARWFVAERDWVMIFDQPIAVAVQALVAAGAPEDAAPLVDAMTHTERATTYPWVLEARGRLALARGDREAATALLERAVSGEAALGYKLDELNARVALAEARGGDGLSEVAAEARAMGARLIERFALQAAERCGVTIERPEDSTDAVAAPVEAGERLVTVMFADVRGYTEMTRSSAPAEMTERMVAFYRWARREIERSGGMVDGYAGDAVMASFNVSQPALDHCEQAVAAAMALQEKAALAGLPVGVGIAVGPAVVGRLTGDENINVIGETTNLAARLQAQAQPGEIVLSGEAYRRAKARIDSGAFDTQMRQLKLKGFDDDVTAHVIRPV